MMLTGRLDAVLLDRDGTINVKAPEGEYITRPDQLMLLPGAAPAIAALNRARVPVVVVTNQRGIALGRMTEDDLAAVHSRLRLLLRRHGASVHEIYHCPHDKGRCRCRKPGTVLLERAREHLALPSLRHSALIGDSLSDVLAGRAVGARALLLRSERAAALSGFETAGSLLEAVRLLMGGGPAGASAGDEIGFRAVGAEARAYAARDSQKR
jgi:D-glycero-D-manno-heptose 1,7-bisphosphate phosphatase